MKIIYEGTIGNYSFRMIDGTAIEVWSDLDNENPDSYIFVRDGTIKCEKDFHMEISYWHMENN